MSVSIDQIDWKQMGVITEETSFNELLLLYVLSTIGFSLFYYANKMFFPSIVRSVCGPESPFFSLKEKDVKEYHSRNVADLHALIAAPLSFYVCFYACDDPEQNIFSSQQCLMKPQKSMLYLITISCGYVTYDLFLCILELGYTMKSGADFIMHHIVGMIGAYAVMVAGRFNVALSAGNLFCEWTSFSMN